MTPGPLRHRVRVGAGDLVLSVASASDTGRVRSVNEDAALTAAPVFAVADGMGGHAFGDRASAEAVRVLREELVPTAPGEPVVPSEPVVPVEPGRVLAAIRRANAAVRDLASGGRGRRVIAGTTLAGLALVAEHPDDVPRWMVFNLGDSRVYRWDAGARVLEQVTTDHSVVQELLDAGIIDEERALVHPDRHIITRALGAGTEVEPEAWLLPATRAQTFLVCSDGLTKELDDVRIAELLESDGAAAVDPVAAVDRLVAAALDAGGRDNVTVVIVTAEYRGADLEASGDREASEPIDEQTRDRALSPELDDTRPRLSEPPEWEPHART